MASAIQSAFWNFVTQTLVTVIQFQIIKLYNYTHGFDCEFIGPNQLLICGLMVILQCRKVAAIPQKNTLKPTPPKKTHKNNNTKTHPKTTEKHTRKLRICEENYPMSCNIQQQIWCSFHWFVNTSQMPKLTSYLCDLQTADCMLIVCWFFKCLWHIANLSINKNK